MAGDVVSAASPHLGEVVSLASKEDIHSLRAGRYLDAPAGSAPPNALLAMRLSDHGLVRCASHASRPWTRHRRAVGVRSGHVCAHPSGRTNVGDAHVAQAMLDAKRNGITDAGKIDRVAMVGDTM
ncbi:hypothetical protein [Xanthomonas vasicola]|uniref:hypothetical protein n=1 Tax=Xanthomonas vasicola TaxID=56459 RepID=UPI000AD8161B|nr:hypothetical protein [Xanthomonas vasicola]